MGFLKRLLGWRKYKRAATEAMGLAKEAMAAADDGKLDEEEAMRLSQRLVTTAFQVKDLL